MEGIVEDDKNFELQKLEDNKSLLEDAKNFELQKLEENKSMLLELSALDSLLNEVYEARRAGPQDYDVRRDLIRIFNEIAQEIHGNDDKCPVVKAFGSYLMELFDAGCDLDLSVILQDDDKNTDRFAQVNTLRKFRNKFSKLQKRRHVSDVELILSARVPVLKVTDNGSGVECDLSVGNLDGILKSQIVRMISDIDERFRKLSVLMKLWAKAKDINSAKDGTINSYSFILLVAFHLQTRDIPILPPFSAILKDGLDPAAVNKNIQHFLKYGERNKESLAELFVSMLIKLESVSSLWTDGLCASTYEGSWILKKLGAFSIEDFTDRSQNTCRALKRKNTGQVFSCVRDSINKIRLFIEHKIDAIQLKNLLFQAKAKPRTKSVVVVKPHKRGKRKRQLDKALQRIEEKQRLRNEEKQRAEMALLQNEEKQRAEIALVQNEEKQRAEMALLQSEEKQRAEMALLQSQEKQREEMALQQNKEKQRAEMALLRNEEKERAEMSLRQSEEKQRAEMTLLQSEEKQRAKMALLQNEKKQRAEMALLKSKKKLSRPKNTHPNNIKAPAPSYGGRVGGNNVCSTSYGRIDKSQEVLPGDRNQHLFATNTFGRINRSQEVLPGDSNQLLFATNTYGRIEKSQDVLPGDRNQHLFASNTFHGSRVLGPEVPLNYPAGRQIRMHNPPVVGYGGIRSDGPQRWPHHHHHTPPTFMPDHSIYAPQRNQMGHHYGSAQNFQEPVNYQWSSRPSSFVSPHQPPLPSAPYPFPAMPPQFAPNSLPPDSRENSGHRPYQPRGNHPSLPFRRF